MGATVSGSDTFSLVIGASSMLWSYTERFPVPLEYAKDVQVPTFVVQVYRDSTTRPSDVQGIYDNLPVADKKLYPSRCSTGSTATSPDLLPSEKVRNVVSVVP